MIVSLPQLTAEDHNEIKDNYFRTLPRCHRRTEHWAELAEWIFHGCGEKLKQRIGVTSNRLPHLFAELDRLYELWKIGDKQAGEDASFIFRQICVDVSDEWVERSPVSLAWAPDPPGADPFAVENDSYSASPLSVTQQYLLKCALGTAGKTVMHDGVLCEVVEIHRNIRRLLPLVNSDLSEVNTVTS